MKAGVPVSKREKDTQVLPAISTSCPITVRDAGVVPWMQCKASAEQPFFCPMFVFLVIRSVDCSPGKGRARKTQVVQLIATSAKKSGRLCMRSAQSQWMSTRLYKYVCKSGGEYSFFFFFVLPNFPKKIF
jgi:hypothetical protein